MSEVNLDVATKDPTGVWRKLLVRCFSHLNKIANATKKKKVKAIFGDLKYHVLEVMVSYDKC